MSNVWDALKIDDSEQSLRTFFRTLPVSLHSMSTHPGLLLPLGSWVDDGLGRLLQTEGGGLTRLRSADQRFRVPGAARTPEVCGEKVSSCPGPQRASVRLRFSEPVQQGRNCFRYIPGKRGNVFVSLFAPFFYSVKVTNT